MREEYNGHRCCSPGWPKPCRMLPACVNTSAFPIAIHRCCCPGWPKPCRILPSCVNAIALVAVIEILLKRMSFREILNECQDSPGACLAFAPNQTPKTNPPCAMIKEIDRATKCIFRQLLWISLNIDFQRPENRTIQSGKLNCSASVANPMRNE